MLRPCLLALLSCVATASYACPDASWTPIDDDDDDDCVKLFLLPKTYYEAEEYCTLMGAHLVSIHNVQELSSLNAIVGNYGPLIGLKCDMLNDCYWTDGTAFDFINGQPNLQYGNCFHLLGSNEQFYSWNCQTPMNSFVCRHTNASKICSPGYTAFKGLCVEVKTLVKEANEAERQCAIEGGHLASIHNSITNEYYTDLLVATNLNKNAHIGIRTNNSIGWTDTSSYNYNNWAIGYPNSHFGLCGQLLSTNEYGGIGEWTSILCIQKLPYICVKEEGVSPMFAAMNCPSMQTFLDYGTVYSPGFPLAVPPSSRCEYLLAGVVNSSVTVNFSYFSIDSSSSVSIYRGMSDDLVVSIFDWDATGFILKLADNVMKIVFETSPSSYGNGWQADFYSTLRHH